MSDYLKYINYDFKQESNIFKVNTDTALLGMFIDDIKNKTVLDIGCGSGALLLYSHYHKASKLIGVDIQKEALKYADINLSKYTDNYVLHNKRIQDYKGDRVDIIVTNPPFFKSDNKRKTKSYKKAMFDDELSIDDLFKAFKKNLKDNGSIYLIYSADRVLELFDKCKEYKYKIMKMQFIYDKNNEFASRVMLKLKQGKMTRVRVLKPIILGE